MAADGSLPLSGSVSLPSLSTLPGQARAQQKLSIDAEQNREVQQALLDAKKRLVRAQRLARKQSVQLSTAKPADEREHGRLVAPRRVGDFERHM